MWLLKEHVHIEQIYSVNKPSGHNFYLTHISKRIPYTNVLYREYSLNTTVQRNTVKRFGRGKKSTDLPFLCQSILWSSHTNSLSSVDRSVNTGTLSTWLGVHTVRLTTENKNTLTHHMIWEFNISHTWPHSLKIWFPELSCFFSPVFFTLPQRNWKCFHYLFKLVLYFMW